MGKHVINVSDEADGQWRKWLHANMRQKDITLNICCTKTGTFQSQHTTQPALFRATNSLPTKLGKRVALHHFHRNYPCLSKLQLAKVGEFF